MDGLQVLRTTAIRQQSVMADSHKPFGQDMHQELADKLLWMDRHRADLFSRLSF